MMSDDGLSAFDKAVSQLAGREKEWSVADAVILARALGPSRNPQASVDVVFTDGERPFDLLPDTHLHLAPRQSGPGFDVVWLADEDGTWTVSALETEAPGVFLIVGGTSVTDRRWKRVERWFNAAHGISRCFLNHRDFEGIGNALGKLGTVEVSRSTARKVTDMSSISRGFPALQDAPRPDHLVAIAEAESQLASVRTLTLAVKDELSFHLRRLAGATLYTGDVRAFERLVLSRLVSAAHERRMLMSARARVGQQAARPLRISLERDLLKSAEDTGEVIAQISKNAKATVAVFHRNPYLHLAVTDEVDGSNFDVMVTEPDSIEIYPGFRASAAALTRLCQDLSERFGASEVVELETQRVSLQDLVS